MISLNKYRISFEIELLIWKQLKYLFENIRRQALKTGVNQRLQMAHRFVIIIVFNFLVMFGNFNGFFNPLVSLETITGC